LKEMESLLKLECPSIDEIIWFEWRVRSSEEPDHPESLDLNDYAYPLRPAQEVHVDQSPAAAIKRVRFHKGKDAEESLRHRVRILKY